MKAVVLEDYAIQQGDLDWSGVKALVPDITRYGRTAQEEVVPRIGDAEIVFLNKCRIDEAVLAQCPKLRWVGIIATGTDNLDLKACRRHGVPVANVPGYSTYSVAQMTFSLLLAICQCADRYHRLVQDGQWRTEEPAAYGSAAAGGTAGQDLWHLWLRQHWPADRPHCQGLWHGGVGVHPHRSAGVRSRRCGVRGS